MNGNGGNIIFWADNDARCYGRFEANGGVLGGDGGFIETSAKYLDFQAVGSASPYKGLDLSLIHI